MGNKNNQNKNQATEESQTVPANDDGQDTAQPSADAQPAAAEQPNGDTNAESSSADNGAPSPAENGGGKPDDAGKTETAAKKVTMTLRHKSHTPHYHRSGLTLTKVFADYEVPEDCVERIKGDKWIEVKGAK